MVSWLAVVLSLVVSVAGFGVGYWLSTQVQQKTIEEQMQLFTSTMTMMMMMTLMTALITTFVR